MKMEKMKKTYFTPLMKVLEVSTAWPLAVSGVESDKDISYGGVDEDGSLEPAARRRPDVWDDGQEEAAGWQ